MSLTTDDLSAISQIMTTTVSASEARLTTEFDGLSASINSRVDLLDTRLDDLDSRFADLDGRFDILSDSTDNRFDSIDNRFDSLLTWIDNRFDTLSTSIDNRFDSASSKLDRVEERIYKGVIEDFGQIEVRLQRLERKVLD